MNIEDIRPGESWACKFKTVTFLDSAGTPVSAPNLALGQSHPGMPGNYTSVGIIQIRDIENNRVQLQDVESQKQFTVAFEDCWDVDRIEWQED